MIISNKYVSLSLNIFNEAKYPWNRSVPSHFFQNYSSYCNQPQLLSDFWVGHCIVNWGNTFGKSERRTKEKNWHHVRTCTRNPHKYQMDSQMETNTDALLSSSTELSLKGTLIDLASRLQWGHFTFFQPFSASINYLKRSIIRDNVCVSVGHKIMLCLCY